MSQPAFTAITLIFLISSRHSLCREPPGSCRMADAAAPTDIEVTRHRGGARWARVIGRQVPEGITTLGAMAVLIQPREVVATLVTHRFGGRYSGTALLHDSPDRVHVARAVDDHHVPLADGLPVRPPSRGCRIEQRARLDPSVGEARDEMYGGNGVERSYGPPRQPSALRTHRVVTAAEVVAARQATSALVRDVVIVAPGPVPPRNSVLLTVHSLALDG